MRTHYSISFFSHLKFLAICRELKNKNPLTTRVRGLLKVVLPGFEPGTQGFSVLCSTN